MVLADRGYPKGLAFHFLEEIQKLFQDELRKEFGTGSVDYRSKIETIDKVYAFLKFGEEYNVFINTGRKSRQLILSACVFEVW
jgi:hypothetical protein